MSFPLQFTAKITREENPTICCIGVDSLFSLLLVFQMMPYSCVNGSLNQWLNFGRTKRKNRAERGPILAKHWIRRYMQ